MTQFSETMARRMTAPDSTLVPGMTTLSSTTAPSSICTPAKSTLPSTVPLISPPSAIIERSTRAVLPI